MLASTAVYGLATTATRNPALVLASLPMGLLFAQQRRITGTSMLDKSAVDQMVRDAQEHAEEDRQRREEVETRNQAEALVFQTEKVLGENGDKLPAEGKAEAEFVMSLTDRV